jgi:site-specific recombinase XerD
LKTLLKEKITCAACGVTDYPFISDPAHCRKCHRKEYERNWTKAVREKTIVCISCGKEKPGWKKKEMICYVCDEKRRLGHIKCGYPGCNKRAKYKEAQLCERHQGDSQAATLLREYVNTYKSPFPQNQRYWAQLVSAIDWEAVDNGLTNIRGRDFRRFRAFASFLETYELPEVLTWRAIDNALPRLDQTNSVKIGFIRSCLFELGDLLAERGEMQERGSYLHENGLRRSLERSPAVFLTQVSRFQQWLLSGMVKPNVEEVQGALTIAPRTMLERMSAVTRFLNFCVTHNTESLAQIGPSLIAKYQQTILWQLECKECHKRIPFDSQVSIEKCPNKECDGIKSYIRIRRLTRGSLGGAISHLRVFFDWAELHGLVTSNPFAAIVCGRSKAFTIRNERGEMLEIAEAIRRYDDSVVEKLCADIVAPDADPEEVIVLYFIIFHLLENWDLRNLRMPSSQAKHFEYLELPMRQVTRGKRSVARKETKVMFHPKALPWLRPILERYYKKRASMVKVDHQQHFLVNERTARCNKSVTKIHVTNVVRRVSLKVLGGVVTASDLRNTAADISVQHSNRRGAILTCMGYSALAATRFNYLERFPLQLKKNPRRRGRTNRATELAGS